VARSAKSIIDAAVEEGAKWERLCFVFVALAGLVSLGVMVTGAVMREGLIALSGGVGGVGIVGSLLTYASKIRRDKIRIRLYEVALAMAKTAPEAAEILREVLGRPAKSEGKSS
jgi:hypothetical protein